MFIYNTTFLVTDRCFNPWFKWLKEEHIPNMLNTRHFSKPQIAKVLTTESDQEGMSFSVQFIVNDLENLQSWIDNNNEIRLQNNLSLRFGAEVLSFSTILELMD
ncbi:MAG: hypothetical protein H6Q19_12 [Bacteroidetes bacterium]|nr:hypothetical protein [Bacteroidota bacterium]